MRIEVKLAKLGNNLWLNVFKTFRGTLSRRNFGIIGLQCIREAYTMDVYSVGSFYVEDKKVT